MVIKGQKTISDSLKTEYQREGIYQNRKNYLKGDQKISYIHLKKEFSLSTAGLKEYQNSRNKFTASFVFTAISTASLVTACIVYRNNKDLAAGFLIGSTALNFISFQLSIERDKHTQNALWLRNKDLLFPEK